MMRSDGKKLTLRTSLEVYGNWHYKDDKLPVVRGKPVGLVHLSRDFTYVFCHDELLQILDVYLRADIRSIELIKAGKAGSITNAEKSLKQKLLAFLEGYED